MVLIHVVLLFCIGHAVNKKWILLTDPEDKMAGIKVNYNHYFLQGTGNKEKFRRIVKLECNDLHRIGQDGIR